MTNTKINQTVEFSGEASRIYNVLTTSDLFSKVTGAPAEIDNCEGGTISLFGGMISGKNLRLVADKLVVQEWRPKNWPEDVVSTVSFELRESGNKTILSFEHSGFPADQKAHLESGWVERYWEPIKKYIAQ